MGQFSYACKTCGGHEQFDWITPCVVELALTTGKTIHVEGYYDGYGGVICRVGEDKQVKVYDKQFEEFFEHWGEVQILSRCIMCNGSLPAGPRGTPPPRLCVPAGVRVLKRIPVRSYNNLERLAPSDGGAEGDVREQYDPEGERNEMGSQLPGLMLDAMLRGVM